ncbi:MAG TPA: Co2+/Mg2+ efflux protein ApaG [Spongiibacteraceae bacterium]|nr:Co2+/Mg2+ efflux protein ApaG [Spongiibacteraceae bacterium]
MPNRIDPDSNEIEIEVATRYLAEQSTPAENRFVFAYTITINNRGDEAVRLLNRHWRITDANNRVQEVRGEGVVGEQPLIAPGGSYRYTSGSLLETAVGTMEGSYEMISISGRSFNAPIAVFSLAQPGALH